MASEGSSDNSDREGNPIDVARGAIRRLFEAGQIDEDHATAALLALDVGIRRVKRQSAQSAAASHHHPDET